MDNSNNNFNIQTLAVFKESPILGYIYKKTERLVSALYLLSNIISDKEPIKWLLRERGLELVSKRSFSSDRSSFLQQALTLLSFLEIAYLGGLISEMNFNVFKQEFQSLISAVEDEDQKNHSKSIIFPEHFWETDKGQANLSDRLSIKKTTETVKVGEKKIKDKSGRHDTILGLLKKGGELGIKDFTESIKDCSEKTIQRELVSLVSKGLVRKTGEKRWSRYSLK